MACPRCGCKVHYQYDSDEFGPQDERLERCAACSHVFDIEDSDDEDDDHYAEVEREHFGDPDKRTGIYARASSIPGPVTVNEWPRLDALKLRDDTPSPIVWAYAFAAPAFLVFGNEPIWWGYWLMCAMAWCFIGHWSFKRWFA